MILRDVVLILLNLIIVANTDSYNVSLDEDDNDVSDIDVRYSLWPKYNGEGAQPTTLKLDFHSGKPEVLSDVETVQGQLKWASIGFGGLALLVIACFLMIYRKKRSISDANNPHCSIDQTHFRYGLLKSKDDRGELSSMPLTMHSVEDEDQALDVFDVGVEQKRTSLPLSVNLEQHGEDIGFNDSRSGLDNLLVDIEDKNSETLTGNGTVNIDGLRHIANL